MQRNDLLFISLRMRGKGSSCPCWHIKNPPFSPVLTLRLCPPTSPSHFEPRRASWCFLWDHKYESKNSKKNPTPLWNQILQSFFSTSSLEIKASCVNVTLLQPESSSLQPSFFCSKLTSRTQLPTAADWTWKGMLRGFSISLVLESRINSIN